MGLISTLLNLIFGDGRNVLRETAEVFRPNAEADAGRMAAQNAAALASTRPSSPAATARPLIV